MIKFIIANIDIADVHKNGMYIALEEDSHDYYIKDDEGEEAYYSKDCFDVKTRFRSWEIAKLIHEKLLPQGTKLKWADDCSTHFEFVYTVNGKSIRGDAGQEMGCSMFTSDHDYVIVNPPDQEVTFLEAVNSGKLIRYEYEDARDGFEPLGDSLEILSQKYTSDKIRKIIDEGKWFIKN